MRHQISTSIVECCWVELNVSPQSIIECCWVGFNVGTSEASIQAVSRIYRPRYLHIVALSVVAGRRTLGALVDIQAVEAADGQSVAGRTRAAETAGRVLALGVTAARVRRLHTLVQVCRHAHIYCNHLSGKCFCSVV